MTCGDVATGSCNNVATSETTHTIKYHRRPRRLRRNPTGSFFFLVSAFASRSRNSDDVCDAFAAAGRLEGTKLEAVDFSTASCTGATIDTLLDCFN